MEMSRANIVAGASLLVAIAALSLAGFLLAERKSGPGAVTPDVIAKILVDAEAAKLDRPVGTVELPAEKAGRLRAALRQGDLAAASEIATAVLAESKVESWDFQPFTTFAEDYADHVDAGFAKHLDDWVAAQPHEPLPLVMRAQYHYDRGWFLRGGDYSNKVPAADMRGFGLEMGQALADVQAALKMDAGNPYAYLLRLRILQGNGMSQRLFDAFKDGIAHYQNYYPLYRITLGSLQPKWGGSVRQMQGFVDYYAGPAPAASPLKLLYLQLYDDYLSIAGADCWKKDKKQDCVSAEMRVLVSPELQAHLGDALQLYDLTAAAPDGHYLFGRAIEPILKRMLEQSNADFQSGAMLQLAATAMHSNTQLRQEEPGHNDYMIDRLLAHSWSEKGFYENALIKTGDALKDIAATRFPGEAEKEQALADIYEEMSYAYSSMAQHAAAIATAEVSFALGGSQEHEAGSCYGYKQLKAYATALAACDAALIRNPNALTVYFWRAQVLEGLNRKDAALADYAVVAGSHHGFRADAVLDMSMIYFARKDNQGALKLLDSYPYLYDADLSGEEIVALAQNNRCYALMEMERLQEALAACRQSLQHGNIPEAFRKEQELLKRLGGDPAAKEGSAPDQSGKNGLVKDGAPKTNL